MRMTGSTFDEAFSKHYFQVLKELKNGKFDITFDQLRPTSPSDIENDVNSQN